MQEQDPISPADQSEYYRVGGDLSRYQNYARNYSPEFLAKYEATHPKDYAELKKLIAYANPKDENPELKEAIKDINQAIDGFLFEKEVKSYSWGEGVTVETEMSNGQKLIHLRNPAVGAAAALELTEVGEGGYHMSDSEFQYDDLADVSEDVVLFQTALTGAKDGSLSILKGIPEPFIVYTGQLYVLEKDGGRDCVAPSYSDFLIDARDKQKYADFVNKRYRQLVGMEATAPAVAAAMDTSSAEAATKVVEQEEEADPLTLKVEQTRDHIDELRAQYTLTDQVKLAALKETSAEFEQTVLEYELEKENDFLRSMENDFGRSVELGGKIENQYELIRTEWEANYVAPAPRTLPLEADDATLASASAAPRASVPAAPSTVGAAAETTKKIASDTEFAATLSVNGWEKYVTKTGDEAAGSITIKGLDKGTPEYKYSRIQHFFGKSGTAMKLEKPEEYEIKVSGKNALWEPTTQYPEGTLVDADTKNRLWVENGTEITWKKKEAPLVASAPSEVAPVPAPVESSPEVALMSKEELSTKLDKLNSDSIQLKNDTQVVDLLEKQKAEWEAKEDKLFSNKDRITSEIAKIESEKATYEKSVSDLTTSVTQLTADLSAQKDNPDYVVVVDPSYRKSLKLPQPTSLMAGDVAPSTSKA